MLETELKKNTAALEALTAILQGSGVSIASTDKEDAAEPEKVEAPKKEKPAPKKEAPVAEKEVAPAEKAADPATKEGVLELLKQATQLERALLNEAKEGSGTPAESKKPAMLVLKKYDASTLGEVAEADFAAVCADLSALIAGYAE